LVASPFLLLLQNEFPLPETGKAVVNVLERLGTDRVPPEQTWLWADALEHGTCGEAIPIIRHFVGVYRERRRW